MVLLHLFGGATLESENQPITGRSAQRRRIALLALLALARRGLSRDKLIGWLWAETDMEKARRLLSESLYVLRKELGEDAIAVAGDELRLNPVVIECDVVAFENAIEQNDFEQAASLYAGPFLDGFYVSDAPELERWIETERDRLARAYGRVLEKLAEQATAAGRRDDAVTWWRRMVKLDPYSGRYAVGLMQALEAAGHRAAALQHAQLHATLLREELEAEPDPAVAALADRLRESPEPAWAPEAARTPPAAASPAADQAPATSPPVPPGSEGPAPDATLTFLFSDIEGSTALLQRLGPRYARLLAMHHAIVRDCLRRAHGREIDTAGDGFFIAFPTARDAVSAAISIQKRMAETDWPDGVTVRLRMGLHTGEPVSTDAGFVGIDVHRAARICGVAKGGRILLSGVTRELLGGEVAAGFTMRSHGLHTLKDIGEPEHLWEIAPEGAAPMPPVEGAVSTGGTETSTAAAKPVAAAAVAPHAAIVQPAPSRPLWRRRGVVGSLALVLLSGAIVLSVLGRAPGPVAPAGPGTSVVVVPFQCVGCEARLEYLRDAMVLQLTTLLEVGELRTVPASLVLRDTSEMRQGPDPQSIAARFGATHAVVGYITATGGANLTVTAELHRSGAASSEARTFEARGSADNAESIARSLAGSLIEALIEGPGRQFVIEGMRAAESTEVMKAWVEGEREFAAARYPQARDAFERAVRADSTFAHGHYRLSMALEWNLQFQEAHRAAADALRHLDRLSPRQARLIRAWDALLKGRVDDAERAYTQSRNDQTDDVEAWYGLGEVAAHFSTTRGESIEPARERFLRVFELLAPDGQTAGGERPLNYGDARHHLLEFAAADRDSTAFDRLLEGVDTAGSQWLAWQAVRAFGWGDAAARSRIETSLERELEETTIGTAAARVGASVHDFEGARRIAAILATRAGTGDDWRAGAHLMMAEFSFASGRPSQAMGDAEAAAPFEPAWAHEMRGLFALPGFSGLSADEITALRDEILDWDVDERTARMESFLGVHFFAHKFLRLYLLGMLSVRLGDLDSAQQYRRTLARESVGPDNESLRTALETGMRAHEALTRGDTATALNLLRGIQLYGWMEQVGFSPFYSRAYDRLVIAELLRDTGEYDEALRWYRSLTEGYDVLFVAPAHYRMAGIFEELAEPDSARTHRAEFDRLWAAADSSALEGLTNARW